MGDVLNIVARLNALEQSRAIRCATHRQCIIQPHALIICPLAMAGEDTTIHALAVGMIGQPPAIRVVPDPRIRDDQYTLVSWLGETMEDYYRRCRMLGDFPQIWVSSGAAAGHLDILADRLRFTRDNVPIKRVGELLTYATERHPVDGQQALITATAALAAHFATGQHQGEDEHLGVFLTWLAPPPGQDLRAAITRAEREVMGVKTDPLFDRHILQPLVTAYNQSRGQAASAAELTYRGQAITAALTPIVSRIYEGVQLAIRYLQTPMPQAAVLAQLRQREANAFQSFMHARDEDQPLPYRDKPRAAAFKIVEREMALQDLEADARYGDALALARARWEGHVLSGTVENVTLTKVPRTTEIRFDVVTRQTNLHMRSRDVLAAFHDPPRLQCAIEAVHREGDTTRVTLRMTKGMRAFGPPVAGTAAEFAPPPADWGRLGRSRDKMSKRLAVLPWTHDDAMPLPQPLPLVAKPADLLAAVEGLR